MVGDGAKFGCKQEVAIAALLTKPNAKERFRVAGIGTLDTIPMAEAAGFFKVPTGFGQSIGRMQQASGAAVSTMCKIVGDPSTPASTPTKVARTILELGKRATQLEDMEVRLAGSVASAFGRFDTLRPA